MLFRALLLLSLLMTSGCQRSLPPFQPLIVYEPTQRFFSTLPSVFPTLSRTESLTDWGREYQIGRFFAKDFDFYRAITSYKRARIILTWQPASYEHSERLKEVEYHILLCYYLAGQCQDAVEWFETSQLAQVSSTFPAFEDLLILLYDAYMRDGRTARATAIHAIIEKGSADLTRSITLSQMLQEGNLEALECINQEADQSDGECGKDDNGEKEDLEIFLSSYRKQAKSTEKARWLNAVLPGAGYAYVGLPRSGWTSFCLNALFGWATYQFFSRGETAAALITLGFETGWYFGGIYGSGLAAKQYNERLYEEGAKELLMQRRLFPALMLEYAF